MRTPSALVEWREHIRGAARLVIEPYRYCDLRAVGRKSQADASRRACHLPKEPGMPCEAAL